MEGIFVSGVTLPSRWHNGPGCALWISKSTGRVTVPRRRNGVRCSEGQDAENYLQAFVVEAEKMVPSHGQLFMKLTDGREVEVTHVNPSKGHLLYRASTPTIFLKMADESNLMLPIVVGEAALALVLKGLHDSGTVQGRPNQYQILKDIVDALNYEARMVRVTERVLDTYYARIYIGKAGDEELTSVDARPSDAINLAVRCNIPIYVNKSIVAADAVRPVFKPTYQREPALSRISKTDAFLDSADVGPDIMAEEITLMKNMLVAVMEERYVDAAHWRDELTKFRAVSEWQLRQTDLRG